jgi:hypothetical protein
MRNAGKKSLPKTTSYTNSVSSQQQLVLISNKETVSPQTFRREDTDSVPQFATLQCTDVLVKR